MKFTGFKLGVTGVALQIICAISVIILSLGELSSTFALFSISFAVTALLAVKGCHHIKRKEKTPSIWFMSIAAVIACLHIAGLILFELFILHTAFISVSVICALSGVSGYLLFFSAVPGR